MCSEPRPRASLITLTTGRDIPSLTSGDDTVDGAAGTFNGNDVITDSSSTDNDTINITETGAIPAGTISGIENININLDSFSLQTVNASNFLSGALTLTQTQTGGATSTTVNNVSAGLDIVADSTLTGTVTVGLDAASDVSGVTIDASNAATVAVTDIDSDGASVTGSEDGTINLDGTGNSDDAATLLATSTDGNVVTVDAATTDLVENLTLSGDNGSVHFDVTTGDVSTVTATGDQDVTYQNSGANITGDTITNNLSSGTFTVVADAANALDLTSADADVFELAADFGGNNVTVSDGDTVKLSNTQGAPVFLTSATGDNTINVDVETTTVGAAVFTDANFSTVNLEVDNNDNTTDTATFTGTNFGANNTVNASGSDNLTLAGTTTAGSVNASNLSGVLTAALTANFADVTGGSGNDVITAVGTNAASTVATGGGDDSITLGANAQANDVTVDGGADTDTVSLAGNVNTTGTTALSLSNVEIVDLGGNTLNVDSSEVDGASFVLRDQGNANTAATVAMDSTSVDLSGITVNPGEVDVTVAGTAVADTITGTNDGDTVNAAGGGDTINGGAGDDNLNGAGGADTINGDAGVDTINGGSEDDTINGGDGGDTLNGDAGADTISGGAGGDIIDGGTGDDAITTGSDTDTVNYHADDNTTVDGSSVETISDYELGTDVLSFDTNDDDEGTNDDAQVIGDQADEWSNGIATGALANDITGDASLADAIATATDAGLTTTPADNDVFGFEYGGNTYILHADGAGTVGNVVQLTGLSASSIAETTDEFTIS